MYKFVDCEFNRSALIELFSNSTKQQIKSLYQVTEPLVDNQCIDEIFEQFDFIAHNNHNVELGELSHYIKPYISPGNNGLLIIPLEGSLTMNFYGYHGTRESLSPFRVMTDEEFKDIKSTHIESVIVDKPMIFNGLVPHDYFPNGKTALIAILKIPLDISWESVIDWCVRRDSNSHPMAS